MNSTLEPSRTELILGGTRSGKSRLAEKTAIESHLEVIYIATASAQDAEMAQRIQTHQNQRPDHWTVIEEPLYLAQILLDHASERRCLLVDCLTLWLTNLLMLKDQRILNQQTDSLLKCLEKLPGLTILVSNETGLGIIPMGELSRRFSDEAGFLHQRLGEVCDRVTFTVAGLAQVLK